jgi:hypothetical protein
LGVPEHTLWERLLHHRGVNYKNFDEVTVYEPNGPVILASELSPAQMARLAESENDFPGVDFQAQPVRNYPYKDEGSHLFGYVGAITQDEYEQLRHQGYSPNDVVGKDGLERQYDRYLRGRIGGQEIEVNASGALVKRLDTVDPVPGNTLVTTIDWRLQRIAEKNLKAMLRKWGGYQHRRLAGAVVAIDPSNGGILALASYPEFDPNDFATPISGSKFARYLNDALRPLYDRAIGAASPTGSTFKMVTGSGAISSGVIKPNQVLYDSGAWDCHGVVFRDIAAGGLGTVAFIRALAASSDGYFYQLGYRLGHDRLIRGQLADHRMVDARVQTAARAQRRVSTRDRAGRDGSDAAANCQRHGHGRQRRNVVSAAHRRSDSFAARKDHQAVRSRGDPQSQRHGRVAARSPRRNGEGHRSGRHGVWVEGRRIAVRRQDRDGRDRRQRQQLEHDLVRGLCPERSPNDRNGGLHGTKRRLRRERRSAGRTAYHR